MSAWSCASDERRIVQVPVSKGRRARDRRATKISIPVNGLEQEAYRSALERYRAGATRGWSAGSSRHR